MQEEVQYAKEIIYASVTICNALNSAKVRLVSISRPAQGFGISKAIGLCGLAGATLPEQHLTIQPQYKRAQEDQWVGLL